MNKQIFIAQDDRVDSVRFRNGRTNRVIIRQVLVEEICYLAVIISLKNLVLIIKKNLNCYNKPCIFAPRR